MTYVAVVGPADAGEPLLTWAHAVGAGLAERGAVVVTGGLGGVMAAACRGARQAGGLTVGLLPGTRRVDGNEHLSVALPTGMGEGRNVLVVRASDAVVAVGGSWGTLSEVALALRTGIPVVALGGWQVADASGRPLRVPAAATPQEAVQLALAGRR